MALRGFEESVIVAHKFPSFANCVLSVPLSVYARSAVWDTRDLFLLQVPSLHSSRVYAIQGTCPWAKEPDLFCPGAMFANSKTTVAQINGMNSSFSNGWLIKKRLGGVPRYYAVASSGEQYFYWMCHFLFIAAMFPENKHYNVRMHSKFDDSKQPYLNLTRTWLVTLNSNRARNWVVVVVVVVLGLNLCMNFCPSFVAHVQCCRSLSSLTNLRYLCLQILDIVGWIVWLDHDRCVFETRFKLTNIHDFISLNISCCGFKASMTHYRFLKK